MPARRFLTALIATALLAAAGPRAPADAGGWAAPIAQSGGIARLDTPLGPVALLAASAATPFAAAELADRGPSPAPRSPRVAPPQVPQTLRPAHIAALAVSRLAWAHDSDVARIGWFSFGSTAPPPFHG